MEEKTSAEKSLELLNGLLTKVDSETSAVLKQVIALIEENEKEINEEMEQLMDVVIELQEQLN